MKKTISIICVLLAFVSCKQKPSDVDVAPEQTPPAVDIHTAENSLDYQGTYTGVLPSASGEGMEVTLKLRKDNSYILQTVYLGKEDNLFEDKGDYIVEGNLLTLKVPKGEEQYFHIGENQLIKLDNGRQRITGDLASQYILKKKVMTD